MVEYTGIEKRRSPRVPDGIKARLLGTPIEKLLPVVNISYHGALVRSERLIDLGKTVNLAMLLPNQPEPLEVKGRVVRAVTVCSLFGFCSYDLGVEFLNLYQDQKEKLTNTIYYLVKKTGQRPA